MQRIEQCAPVQAVARADEMHGVAHQVQPYHLTLFGQCRQLVWREILEPGPQSHVRGERRLGLHPAQVLDHVDRRCRRAFEQALAGQRSPVESTLAQHLGHCNGPKKACRSAASWAGASIAGKCLPRWNSVQCAPADAGISLRTVSSAPKTAKPCGTADGAPQSDECACSYRVCAAVAPEPVNQYRLTVVSIWSRSTGRSVPSQIFLAIHA